MFEFKLPDLGEGIHEGEIVKWYVQIGDMIKEDDSLVDVETDKAAVTIPSPVSGKVIQLGGKVGDTVMVGEVIAVIEEIVAEPEVAPAIEVPATIKGPPPATPATRRLARELGVDLKVRSPTSPGSRITVEDVKLFAEEQIEVPVEEPIPVKPEVADKEAAAESRAAAEYAAEACATIPFLDLAPLPDFEQWGPVEKQPLRSIRRKVAHKMVTSMTLIPHVAHMDEADVTLLEEFRLRERARREGQPGGHLTLLAFVIKAVTAGLKATSAFNATLDPFKEEIIYKNYYNIGIAVDTGKGLVVPVIHNTDRKSIMEISAAIEDLAKRARETTIEVAELQGGTFTSLTWDHWAALLLYRPSTIPR